jgi:hypothetical protein
MKSTLRIAGAVIVAAGLTTAAVSIGSTATGARQALPVALGFDNHQGWARGEIRPRTVYFGAGGSLFVRGLTWTSWGKAAALGRGTRWIDDCVPNCAAGSYARSAATVTLWRARSHDGRAYFSRMTLEWQAGGRSYRQVFRWSPGTGTSAMPFWH